MNTSVATDFRAMRSSELKLPACPMPRPGDRISWHTGPQRVEGTLTGHDSSGLALINDHFGNGIRKPFTEIRLCDPYQSTGPNWSSLAPHSKILEPSPHLSSALNDLLKRRIPPGIRYIDLITEVWQRGFEIFLVGGSVRDSIAGLLPRDVDLVTTMPLFKLQQFLPSMLRYKPTVSPQHGYVRIGQEPDPFIDLKVFSSSLTGTPDAVFGVGFDRDMAHRDFACNAVYYDPINNALIDPSGNGIHDATERKLSFICGSTNVHQHAQIFIRTIKFSVRGYGLCPVTLQSLQGKLAESVPSMRRQLRKRYLRTQLLGKCPSKAEHRGTLCEFREHMAKYGLQGVWDQHFEPIFEELLA